jgi:thiosulfate dehydrogenase [quinone] large subunit
MNAVLRATDAVSRSTPLIVRVTAGLLWLSNVSWKVPPDFGESEGSCTQLCGYVQAGIDHPVAPGYPWVLEHLVQPNLAAFGWTVLIVELALAALLLSGTFTRAAAVVGLVQSAAIGLSVANAPDEWYWSYVLMVVVHLAVFGMAAGRHGGVDGMIRRARPDRPTWLEVVT